LKRVIALLGEAKALAEARDKLEIAELINRARMAALDRLYPAAQAFTSQCRSATCLLLS